MRYGEETAVLPQSLRSHLPNPLRAEPVSGGDINQAFRLTFDDHPSVFVKCHAQAPAGMFAAEASGLAALSAHDASLCPEVLVQTPDALVLEWVDFTHGPCGAATGRALAQLHRQPTPNFGGQAANFLGTLKQDQPVCNSWAELYGRHRLAPLAPALDRTLRRDLDRLLARLPDLLDLPDPPSLIHGDLWGGNAGQTAAGRALLFDPAHASAHREQDLAMTQLFGGFSQDFYSAYEEVYPLTPGWRTRVALHQVYPLLAHVALFGAHYADQAHQAMKRYL